MSDSTEESKNQKALQESSKANGSVKDSVVKKKSKNKADKPEEIISQQSEIRKLFRFGLAYLLFIIYLYSFPSFISVPEEILYYREIIIFYTLVPFVFLLFIRLKTFDLMIAIIHSIFKKLDIKILLKAITYIKKEKSLVKKYLIRVFVAIYLPHIIKLILGVYLDSFFYSIILSISGITILFDTIYTFKLADKFPTDFLFSLITKYVLLTILLSPLLVLLAVTWPFVTYSVSHAIIIHDIFAFSISYNSAGILLVGIFLFVVSDYVLIFFKYSTVNLAELKTLYEVYFIISSFFALDFIIFVTPSFEHLSHLFLSPAQYIPISIILVLLPILLLEYLDKMEEVTILMMLLIMVTLLLGAVTLSGYLLIFGLFSIFAVLVYYLRAIGFLYFLTLLSISVIDFVTSYFLSGGGIVLLSPHLVLYQAGVYIVSIAGIMLSFVEKRVATITNLPETYKQEMKKVATTPLESYIFSLKLRIPDVEERLAGKFVVSSTGIMVSRYIFRLAILLFLLELIVLFPYLLIYINPWYAQLVIMNSPEITIMPFLLIVVLLVLTLRMKKEKFKEVKENEFGSRKKKGKKK